MKTLGARTAAPDDAEAVVALIESAYRGEQSRRGWTTEADLLGGTRTSVTAVRALIAAPRSHILLVEDGDARLLGCAHVEARSAESAYLGMLSVRPDRQGAGTGRRLIEAAEQHAFSIWGAREMHMHVIRQRTELIAWYERLGYRPTGEMLPFPFGDPGIVAKRTDLEFVVLARSLVSPGVRTCVRSAAAG